MPLVSANLSAFPKEVLKKLVFVDLG